MLIRRLLRWTWSSYDPLTLRQRLVAYGAGYGVGWLLLLSLAPDWPVWQRALASAEVAFLWLTLLSWSLRQLQKSR